MIKYVEKSLFEAPEDALLVHACNAQGVWGSGIAKEFAERYPQAYQDYKSYCGAIKKYHPEEYWTGHAHIGIDWSNGPDDTRIINRKVGSLITSNKYGAEKDAPNVILLNTLLALNELGERLRQIKRRPIASNKFNSGLFGVPWEETEKILTYVIKRYKLDWTVYTGEE